MKVVILAAGMGTRLQKYTRNQPKGMLEFNGKTLIQRQIEIFKNLGIDDIIIVTGYKKEKIGYTGVRYYNNEDYAVTNMVETLFCAREEFNSDILVSYSDILYDYKLAEKIVESPHDIAVAVDNEWRRYWNLRYNTTEIDLESLVVSDDGRITEIGKPVYNSAGINHRYIGLIKFSKKGIKNAIRCYDRKKIKSEKWSQSGHLFLQGYLTDLIHEVIVSGNDVNAVVTQNGWLEFDTVEDYERNYNQSMCDNLWIN